MNFWKVYSIPLLLVAMLTLSCATAPLASLDEDNFAKQMKPEPNKSLIYIYRNESLDFFISTFFVSKAVSVDGHLVGNTGQCTYFMLVLDPGSHIITSKAENESFLNLITEAGKTYYVWQEMKLGLIADRTLLHIVDEAEGRQKVSECKLLKSAY